MVRILFMFHMSSLVLTQPTQDHIPRLEGQIPIYPSHRDCPRGAAAARASLIRCADPRNDDRVRGGSDRHRRVRHRGAVLPVLQLAEAAVDAGEEQQLPPVQERDQADVGGRGEREWGQVGVDDEEQPGAFGPVLAVARNGTCRPGLGGRGRDLRGRGQPEVQGGQDTAVDAEQGRYRAAECDWEEVGGQVGCVGGGWDWAGVPVQHRRQAAAEQVPLDPSAAEHVVPVLVPADAWWIDADLRHSDGRRSIWCVRDGDWWHKLEGCEEGVIPKPCMYLYIQNDQLRI